MGPGRRVGLREGFLLAGVTPFQLWFHYLSVGGFGTQQEVLDYARGLKEPSDWEFNLVAQALNEALLDDGRDPVVSYRDPPQPGDPGAGAP
jgi:hypothetical protein